jgi:ribosomal-protein-alanine N-acetyltransferase
LDPASAGRWLDWLSRVKTQFHHIGWHPISYWLSRPAALCLVGAGGAVRASLLASPDQLGTAWLHLFAADSPPGAAAAWRQLWPEAEKILSGMELDSVWAMATQPWLRALLKGDGFSDRGTVIAYCQQPVTALPETEPMKQIVPLRGEDLPAVEALDRSAFEPPWQMDTDALRETLERSLLSAGLVGEGRISGYLMAVATPHGVHLTRLAVDPRDQGRGFGRALTAYAVNHFYRLGAPWITVNTQSGNRRSRQLYHSMGFSEMQETYPVLRIDLKNKP